METIRHLTRSAADAAGVISALTHRKGNTMITTSLRFASVSLPGFAVSAHAAAAGRGVRRQERRRTVVSQQHDGFFRIPRGERLRQCGDLRVRMHSIKLSM